MDADTRRENLNQEALQGYPKKVYALIGVHPHFSAVNGLLNAGIFIIKTQML